MLHLYQDQPIGGADILNSLADVNINNPENKQIIYYDQATGTWRNYDPPFVNSENVLHTVEECAASTNPEDVAGASVASSLNSALTNRNVRCSNEYTFTASSTGGSVNVSTFTVPTGAILIGATITQKTSGGTDGKAVLNTGGANVALLELTSGKEYGVRLLYIMGDV